MPMIGGSATRLERHQEDPRYGGRSMASKLISAGCAGSRRSASRAAAKEANRSACSIASSTGLIRRAITSGDIIGLQFTKWSAASRSRALRQNPNTTKNSCTGDKSVCSFAPRAAQNRRDNRPSPDRPPEYPGEEATATRSSTGLFVWPLPSMRGFSYSTNAHAGETGPQPDDPGGKPNGWASGSNHSAPSEKQPPGRARVGLGGVRPARRQSSGSHPRGLIYPSRVRASRQKNKSARGRRPKPPTRCCLPFAANVFFSETSS